jgi:predicted RNase H-like HicB family nuclease
MTSRYTVVLHPTEEGFAVSCPGLPGCWSQGATEEESLENIQDAIREYLAAVVQSSSAEGVGEAVLREVEVTV